MKRWLYLGIGMMTGLQALYLGNPDLPSAVTKGLIVSEEALVGFRAGFQADYVIDRRLKSYDGANARVDEFCSQWDQGVVTCSVADRVEVYGSVGTMQATFSHRPGKGHERREYQTSYKTTWGGGGRIIAYKWGANCLGVEGGYQWAKVPLKWDALNGHSFTTGADFHYQEWQVGLGFSREVGSFIPYLAVKYSTVAGKLTSLRSDLALGTSHFKLASRDHFGMVVGCSFTTGSDFDLTLESRFIDEQAVSLALDLRF